MTCSGRSGFIIPVKEITYWLCIWKIKTNWWLSIVVTLKNKVRCWHESNEREIRQRLKEREREREKGCLFIFKTVLDNELCAALLIIDVAS